MIIQSKGYYESEIKRTYNCGRNMAFMIRGVSRAFMDIAYGQKYPKA